ncbi:MAG: hypothetical protein U0794_03565 [Isosphaeraceae bacterium]
MSFSAIQEGRFVDLLFRLVNEGVMAEVAAYEFDLGFAIGDETKFEKRELARRLVVKAREVGQLENFLIAVLARYPDQPELKKFAAAVLTGKQPLLPPLLPILKNHLDACNPHAVASYEDARPEGWLEPISQAGGGDLVAINCAFNLAQSSDDALLRYAAALANRVAADDSTASEAIQDWVADAGFLAGTHPPPPPAAPQHKSIPSLMIKVWDSTQGGEDPRTAPSGRYLVRAWLWRDRGQCVPVGEQKEVDESELKGCIQQYREDVQALTGAEPKDLLLEIFLPRSLIEAEIDCWAVRATPRRIASTAGHEHPVVLRTTDRARPQYDRSRMLARWAAAIARPLDTLKLNDQNPPPPNKCIAVTVEDLGLSLDDLYVLLTSGWVDSTGCSLLGRPPRPYPRRNGKPVPTDPANEDTLDLLLAVGFPVILWDRSDKAVAAEIQKAIRDRTLPDLPRLVFESRKAAHAAQVALNAATSGKPKRAGRAPTPPWKLGASLSLLFDQPDRIPPDFE